MTGSTVGKKMPGMHHLMNPVLLLSVMAHLGNTQPDGKTIMFVWARAVAMNMVMRPKYATE